ncbi:MucR family transcriptional regulator [Actibacterium sp. MT2.3-13A]|uniref:MucR family transcriptional regulator n=1 Tax=Actibacterium sp. MT2.3-13A TaxID=2828332 RepID=UPI001BAA6E51|nr:MucR family transcriptional regulator [Actibacterium sp. MT2.3-13A]
MNELMNRWREGLPGRAARPRRTEDMAQRHSAPAVPVEDSVTPNFLICLETGTRQILLRRHLREQLGMSPDEYRRKWGLPGDYPMAAATYIQHRDKVLNMHQQKQS